MAQVAICNVTDGYFVSQLYIFCQRAVARDLKIVRMTANGKNSHMSSSYSSSRDRENFIDIILGNANTVCICTGLRIGYVHATHPHLTAPALQKRVHFL